MNEIVYKELISAGDFFIAKRIDGCYDIVGKNIKIYGNEFDSIIWADREIWGMNIYENGKNHNYFHGQGYLLIEYTHSILISNKVSVFIGSKGLWFYHNGMKEPKPLFRFSPKNNIFKLVYNTSVFVYTY